MGFTKLGLLLVKRGVEERRRLAAESYFIDGDMGIGSYLMEKKRIGI